MLTVDLLAEIVTDYWAGSICYMDTLNKGVILIQGGEGKINNLTTTSGD